MKSNIQILLLLLFCLNGFSQTENAATTIVGKVLCGYQGWFNTENDGSNLKWKHYETNFQGNKQFEPGHVTIDYWPDMSEAEEDEKYPTPFTHTNGTVANVFSSANSKTVNRHFKWMNDYNIDGVFLQRFAINLQTTLPVLKANEDVIADNCVKGAIANNNRLLSIMYDLTGANPETFIEDVKRDWKELVSKYELNNSTKQHLLSYKQKPVVAIWGAGFKDRAYTLEDIQELVNFFKNDATYGGCSVLLGVPSKWRSLNGDSIEDPELHDLIKSADIVHPWNVGRFINLDGVDSHRDRIKEDKAWCDVNNLLYMPVVFPGFSWHNVKKSKDISSNLNSIPRLKGDFFWRQFYNSISENVETIYVAMFDEVDEGTCIFKVDNNPPSSKLSRFSNYEGLPSDYYLWLTGKGREMLRKEISLDINQPEYPNLVTPTTFYVSADGTDNNTGSSEGTSFLTVNKAFSEAKNGNTIYITGSVIHNSVVNIQKDIHFIGLNNANLFPNENRFDNNRMFHISKIDLTVSFSNITFKNNTNTLNNGGVMSMNANSNLSIINCVFDGNSTSGVDNDGGGLFFSQGKVTVQNSTFKNNTSRGNGGGISASGGGLLEIKESLFIKNTAENSNNTEEDIASGGALHVASNLREVLMFKNTFYNNSATHQGGALFFTGLNDDSLLENISVYSNRVTSNLPGNGGGIKINGDRTFEIKNSLIYGNSINDAINTQEDISIDTSTKLTFLNSLAGNTFGLNADDAYSSSKTIADLTSSNLRYNETTGFVEYDLAPINNDTPVDFGSDGNDAGAWNSMHVLSIDKKLNNKDNFGIHFDNTINSIQFFTDSSSTLDIVIYNINGAQVLKINNVKPKQFIKIQHLKKGVYFLNAKNNTRKYSKKIILY